MKSRTARGFFGSLRMISAVPSTMLRSSEPSNRSFWSTEIQDMRSMAIISAAVRITPRRQPCAQANT